MSDLFSRSQHKRKTIRPHQQRAIDMLRQSLARGSRRTVLQAGTGFGKTFVSASIIRSALNKGKRVVFTVPRISLVNQSLAEFEAEDINDIGVIQASHERFDPYAPVQIASLATLRKRDFKPDCDLVIVDEAHMEPKVIYEWMAEKPKMPFIGLTATPWARGMGEHWQDLVSPISLSELIEAGYLSPFSVYAPSHPDLSGVGTGASGDYKENQLSDVMQDSVLVADVVSMWKRYASGLPTLVFAVDLAHAKKIQEQFAQAGIAMGYVECNTDVVERRILLDRMERGEIAGIVSVGTMTTGVDADVRCIVLARPTKSEALFVQMIGRGLRTAPGKSECIILDHSDNHARLGFVTDIRHEHMPQGKPPESKMRERPESIPRECSKCGTLRTRGPCPSCGHEPQRQSDIEFEAGELRKLEPKEKKPPKPKFEDKQAFWSMALWIDQARGKGGKLAKGLYKGRFDVWPRGLSDNPVQPSPEFLSYERSRRIAYTKRMEARRG